MVQKVISATVFQVDIMKQERNRKEDVICYLEKQTVSLVADEWSTFFSHLTSEALLMSFHNWTRNCQT